MPFDFIEDTIRTRQMGQVWWYMPIIPAIWKAELKRIVV
jgi:hypothetical protein